MKPPRIIFGCFIGALIGVTVQTVFYSILYVALIDGDRINISNLSMIGQLFYYSTLLLCTVVGLYAGLELAHEVNKNDVYEYNNTF